MGWGYQLTDFLNNYFSRPTLFSVRNKDRKHPNNKPTFVIVIYLLIDFYINTVTYYILSKFHFAYEFILFLYY